MLVVGSGAYAGCSLYMLTSDQWHALDPGIGYGCGAGSPLGPSCDAVLWPALLTDGAPIAGVGVNPTLLGTVTRTDVLAGGTPVQQVTYAGQPLYRFVFDDAPGDFQGADLFDNVVDPVGTWYLVEPSRGRVAPGQAQVLVEGASANGGTGPAETVLAATMDGGFTDAFADASFPVYTFSGDGGSKSACTGACALTYQPVLTDKQPQAGAGVDRHALGIVVRPDGTHQVTYGGRPLYLYVGDAYLPGLFGGPATIGGNGSAFGGTFSAIPSP
ncbi:MAG TPA: hypothetical protein VFA82_07080 [Gaiellaceae bacterium]|nr:hypothetical protein [Gaiellaceae bacterium]